MELLSSDITKGALIVPATSSDPLSSTNFIIQSNQKLQVRAHTLGASTCRLFHFLLNPPASRRLPQRTFFDNLKAPVPANFVNNYLMMGLPDNTMLGRAKAFLPIFFGSSGGTNNTANAGKPGGAAALAAKAAPAAVAEPHSRMSVMNKIYAEVKGRASGEKDGQDIERGKGGDDGTIRDDMSNAGDNYDDAVQALNGGGGDDKNKDAAQKIILDNG